MHYIFSFLFTFLNVQPSLSSLDIAEQVIAKENHINKELECMQRIVYNESTAEPLLGKKLVAQVTVNRMKSKRFPKSVCGNMEAKGQYSFYNHTAKSVNKLRKYPREYHIIAKEALNGNYSGLLDKNILYFKNCSVYNDFFNKLTMVKRVGNHCFFREGKV